MKINFNNKKTIFFLICLLFIIAIVVTLVLSFCSERCIFVSYEPIKPIKYETVIKTPQFEVRKIHDSLIPFQNGIPYGSSEKKEGHSYIDLSGIWKKERVNVDHKLTLQERTLQVIEELKKESNDRFKVDYNDKNWQDKEIPGMENSPPDRYQGGVWYRRKFNVPRKYKGKTIKLSFEGANYFTDVWINGKWVGAHEGAYIPFSFDVTDYLNYGRSNIIAVRVDNIPWLPHQIIFPEDKEVNDKNIVPYKTGDWWNAGGITRDVYLEVMPKVNIVRADVRTKIDDNNRVQILIDVVIYNDSRRKEEVNLELNIFDTKIDKSNVLSLDAKDITDFSRLIAGPINKEKIILLPKEAKNIHFNTWIDRKEVSFWHPDNPHLYTLGVSLSKQKKIDSFYTQFGIREIKVDSKNCRLLLNNEPIFLRGVARHEVFPNTSGGEKYEGVKGIYEDMLMIKELNANFLRTTHYPNHPATYILADRIGLLIWEEIPVFWFDGPQFELQRTKRKIAKQMWLEMIYRDYNRPSIIFWSTCNECGAQEERRRFIKDLYDIAYKVDGTRLVVQSAAGNDLSDATHEVCDIIGITSYYGVFYGKDYYQDTKEAMKQLHQFLPEKPILLTEFGIWSEADLSNVQTQVMVAQDTYEAISKEDFVCGVTWWCMFDWHTMISEPQTMGLISWDRQKYKPVYFILQRLYGKRIGDMVVSLEGPAEETHLQGSVDFTYSIKNAKDLEEIVVFLDGKEYKKISIDTTEQVITIDTTKLKEGFHDLLLTARQHDGLTISDYNSFLVDNIDEAPTVALNIKDGASIFYKKTIVAEARDDRNINGVYFRVNGGSYIPMEYMGFDCYLTKFDVSTYPDNSIQSIEVKARDSGGNETVCKLNVYVDKKPAIAVSLPFNHDWISYQTNPRDADDFYNYPAEFLPESNSWFIYNGEKKIKFKFGDKKDGKDNNVECRGQVVRVPAGRYRKIYFLAAMHNGNQVHQITLNYKNHPSVKKPFGLSDWWMGNAHFKEEVAFLFPYHHELGQKKRPRVGLYVQTVESEPDKILESITFPINAKVHIFAVTLEK